MAEQHPSQKRKTSHSARQTVKQRMLGYKGNIQGILGFLLPEKNVQQVTQDDVIILRFKKELSDILIDVKGLRDQANPEAGECFRAINTFCERIGQAIMWLDTTLAAWKYIKDNGFNIDVYYGSLEALKRCGGMLDAALQQFLI